MLSMTSPIHPSFLCYDCGTWGVSKEMSQPTLDRFENKNIDGATHGRCLRGGDSCPGERV